MGIVFEVSQVILLVGGEIVIEKVAVDLVCQMTETKLINKDMEERYAYVAVCWLEKTITIGTIILIGISFQKFLPTLFFLFFSWN